MARRACWRIPLLITVVVLLIAPRDSARAQRTEFGVAPGSGTPRRKIPTLARVIGVLPGVGHMYAGETGRGFAYLGGTLGMMMLSGMMLATDCAVDAVAGNGDDQCPGSLSSNAVFAASFGVWGWSIYDAGRAANRTNERNGLRISVRLLPTLQRHSVSRATSAGALIAIRLGLH
jgi:hypothetical protein